MATIRDRFSGYVIVDGEGSLKEEVEKAIRNNTRLQRANLYGANLYGADLYEADLYEGDLYAADLRGAKLRRADLQRANFGRANFGGADLSEADLRGASFYGADLQRANFDGARLNYQSHDLIAAILFSRAGKDVEKRKVAGFILMSRDFCWRDFTTLRNDPLWQWAIDTIAGYVVEGDNAPYLLRERAAELKANTPRDSE